MRLHSLGAAPLLLCLSLSARADTYTTFKVTGIPQVSGTFELDDTSGFFASSDLTVTTSLFTDTLTGGGGSQDGRTGFDIDYFTKNDSYLFLFTSPHSDGTLKGFTGGSVTFTDGRDLAGGEGELVPQITPEPSSFALLGTGLLGVAGVARKRLA